MGTIVDHWYSDTIHLVTLVVIMAVHVSKNLANWCPFTHTLTLHKPISRATGGKLNGGAITGGAPPPHVALAAELAQWVEIVHGTPKVAPRVWIVLGAVKARLVCGPAGLAPVEPCVALVQEVVENLVKLLVLHTA